MRILFSFVGGSGHFDPMVPIARAAEASGHTVAATGQPELVSSIEAAGLTGFATGTNRGLGGDGRGDMAKRLPLAEVDGDREARVAARSFPGRRADDRIPDLSALCDEWRPDVVVHDEMDFAAPIVAERRGTPHARVIVLAAGTMISRDRLAQPLAALRADHGLPPDPEMTMLDRYLVISPGPPSYRDPRAPLPATAERIGVRPADPATLGAPPWPVARPGTPTVYFTLGTILNTESGDLFPRVLDALRDMDINLVMTVGKYIDPAEFGPQPPHVHIARYIPQARVLPHCDLIVSHGGSGSVLGALAHGLPAVLLPLGADQPHNATRCAELGVARVLDALRATRDDIQKAATEVLTDPTYRQAAERLRDENAALPGPEHAVTLLERLVTSG